MLAVTSEDTLAGIWDWVGVLPLVLELVGASAAPTPRSPPP